MNLLKKLSTGAVVAVRRLCAAIAASLLLLSGFNEAVIAQADADPFDAEKFMAAIEVQGAELKARSPAAQLYRDCVHCHGEQGRPASSFYPSLAGQPAGYLVQQLNAYSEGSRQNAIMSSLAKILSAEEINALADYLAAQVPQAADLQLQASNAAVKGRSRAAELGCAVCHGGRYQGQDNYARLAGQGYEYLAIQLTAFRDGGRVDPAGVMPGLAANLSDEDIDNLSRYLSAL